MRYTLKFGYTLKRKIQQRIMVLWFFCEHIIRSLYFPIFKTFSPLLGRTLCALLFREVGRFTCMD